MWLEHDHFRDRSSKVQMNRLISQCSVSDSVDILKYSVLAGWDIQNEAFIRQYGTRYGELIGILGLTIAQIN